MHAGSLESQGNLDCSLYSTHTHWHAAPARRVSSRLFKPSASPLFLRLSWARSQRLAGLCRAWDWRTTTARYVLARPAVACLTHSPSDLGSPQCGRALRREGALYPSRGPSHLRELNLAPYRRRRNSPHTARRRTSLGDEFRRRSVCHDESNLILLADIGALLLLTHVFAAPNAIGCGSPASPGAKLHAPSKRGQYWRSRELASGLRFDTNPEHLNVSERLGPCPSKNARDEVETRYPAQCTTVNVTISIQLTYRCLHDA